VVRDKDIFETAGLLVESVARAAGATALVGTRLLELGEREQLHDPSCQICAEGKKVCLKNYTHYGCHCGSSGEGWGRYPHLDPRLLADSLPPQLKDANAVGRQHRLRRIYLDVRDDATPLLSMMRKGHKRRCGAPKRKVAATIDLPLGVYENGGLDVGSWGGSMA
jgi:hypothetical protein